MASWGILSLRCYGLPLLAAAVGMVVFLILWLREKTARDELILNLLGEIQNLLNELRKTRMNDEQETPNK